MSSRRKFFDDDEPEEDSYGRKRIQHQPPESGTEKSNILQSRDNVQDDKNNVQDVKDKPNKPPRTKKQSPEQMFKLIEPFLETLITQAIDNSARRTDKVVAKAVMDYMKDNPEPIEPVVESRMKSFHEIQSYLITNSIKTEASEGNSENNSTRVINDIRFRLKDLKNWYHIMEMMLDQGELYK